MWATLLINAYESKYLQTASTFVTIVNYPIKRLSKMKRYFLIGAPLMRSPDFETTVIKISRNKENNLNCDKKELLDEFKLYGHRDISTGNLIIKAFLAEKRQRREGVSHAISLEHIPPTSNVCE